MSSNILSKKTIVAILLCTYNGEKFLIEQLKSIENQTHKDWIVIASDDGSKDSTIRILREFQLKWKDSKIKIRNGPRDGYSSNFLYLASDPEIRADYYAFCDQDDVWHKDKLETAIVNLKAKNISDSPLLYCCRSNYVTENLKNCGMSPKKKLLPSFENALAENIAGGNTMVFNQAVKNILEKNGIIKVVSHDWWVYLIVTGVGGCVLYDSNSYIDYRQHKNSVIGSGYQVSSRIKKFYEILSGSMKWKYSINGERLMDEKKMLTKENSKTLAFFLNYRKESIFKKILLIKKLNLYKQNYIENIGFYISMVLGKI